MTWTSKKIGPELGRTGDPWVPLCVDSAPSYFGDYDPRYHLLAKSYCRKEGGGVWQVLITASIYYGFSVPRDVGGIYYLPPKEIGGIPIRVFSPGLKRTHHSVSASWLAARIVLSEENAGSELWDFCRDDRCRAPFIVLLRRLLRESSRHLIIRDVMSA